MDTDKNFPFGDFGDRNRLNGNMSRAAVNGRAHVSIDSGLQIPLWELGLLTAHNPGATI